MKVVDRFDRIERTRDALLAQARAMSQDELTWRPEEGKWSILEILDHLVAAEEDVFQDPQRLPELPVRTRSVRNRLMFWIVMFILRFDIPVKVPSKGMHPKGRELEALGSRWVELQAGVRAFLDGLPDDRRGDAIFAHPVAGPMTVAQMLFMLDVHIQRHARQIDALARRAGADPS